MTNDTLIYKLEVDAGLSFSHSSVIRQAHWRKSVSEQTLSTTNAQSTKGTTVSQEQLLTQKELNL